jgi:hypothetical protein
VQVAPFYGPYFSDWRKRCAAFDVISLHSVVS